MVNGRRLKEGRKIVFSFSYLTAENKISALSFFSQAVSFLFCSRTAVQLCGHVKTQRRDILNGALCAPVFFVVAFFPSYTYYFVVEAHHGC